MVTAITRALARLGTPYNFNGTSTDPHGADPREAVRLLVMVVSNVPLSGWLGDRTVRRVAS